MDPNTALKQLRFLVARAHAASLRTDISVIADEMADVFNGLDNWLSTGGFLPDAWRRGKVP